jgi:hypothetical protein
MRMIPVYYHSAFQDTILTKQAVTDSGSSAARITAPLPQQNVLKTFKPFPVREKPEVVVTKIPFEHQDVIDSGWNSSDFLNHNGISGIVSGLNRQNTIVISHTGTARPGFIAPAERKSYTYDWLLGIFLFLVLLFVWIRIFYNKFFSSLGSALSSFQLSSKLFEEKNVLHQRVSIVLDFIYITVFSVFLFEYIEYTGEARAGMTGIRLFLLLLNIVLLYTISRVIVLRLTGSLFMSRRLFAEYMHNTFVVNKGMGIVLFPLIIMAHYLPFKIVPIVFILGIVVFVAAFLLKTLRAYQIILRRDILLFYLILYLCTLEILPLLLGYKFATSLIQSN